MAHCNTILPQLLKMVGRHEFEKIASTHHQGQRLRKTSRWPQFVALAFGQLSGRQSLRDIESNLQATAATCLPPRWRTHCPLKFGTAEQPATRELLRGVVLQALCPLRQTGAQTASGSRTRCMRWTLRWSTAP